MSRPVLVIDIGEIPLPSVTPSPIPPGAWVPPIKPVAALPPVTGVVATPGMETITVRWDPSPLPGAVYEVWRAPDVSGAPGSWSLVTRTGDSHYTYTDVTGAASWWRVVVQVHGMAGESAPAVVQTPLVPASAAELVELQNELDAEALARFNADAAEALARSNADAATALAAANDATAKATAARVAAIAHADVIGAQVADILAADAWAPATTYPSGDLVQHDGKLYRSLQPGNTNHSPESAAAWWELIGDYASLGEAVAASVGIGMQNASDISAESSRVDVVVARMPGGSGTLATASVVTAIDARVTAAEGSISSQAGTITAITSRIDSAEGALVNEIITSANKDAAHSASINTLSSRLVNAEGDIAGTSGALSSLTTRVTNTEGTITSHSSSLTSLQAQVDALDVDTGGVGSAISELDTRVDATEAAIVSHSSAITALEGSVTSANKVFAQNDPPPTAGRTHNDLWIDTNDGNKIYTFDTGTTSWVPRVDGNKSRIFVQASAPAGATTNDLWFDSDVNRPGFSGSSNL